MKINVENLPTKIQELKSGDLIYLSGKVYTARDAAHKRIKELISKGEALPFPIEKSAIYYAGPTETKKGHVIGSCGPTTSARMDSFTPMLLNMGLICTIGKGERSEDVRLSIEKNKAIYLCAIGGAGALAAKCIESARVIAFDDLGCESVKELILKDLPLIVGIDSRGESIFK